MSAITYDDVVDNIIILQTTTLESKIPGMIVDAEDLLIAQLSYLEDASQIVRPEDPGDTLDIINMMVLWQTRARAFESYYGSVNNEESALWEKRYNDTLKDIRKGYIKVGTVDKVKTLARAEFG